MPRIVIGTPGFMHSTGGFGVYENLDLPPFSTTSTSLKAASSLPYIRRQEEGLSAFPNSTLSNSLLGK